MTLLADATPAPAAAPTRRPEPEVPQNNTARMAAFVETADFDTLSAEAVHATKRIILDTIGCAIGGFNLPDGQRFTDVAKLMGGQPVATLLGSGVRGSAAAAAFANGYLGNLLDADDTFLHSSHPAVLCVTPALALGESRGVSGRTLIASVALGYEVGARVARARIRKRALPNGGTETEPLQASYAYFSFCTAVAGGKALGLDKGQLRSAMGISAATTPFSTSARGYTITVGKHALKYSPTGFYASNGTQAVLLANAGLEGDASILDGPMCFGEMTGAFGLDPEGLFGGLGQSWWITEASLKPYSLCRFTHIPLDIFRDLQRKNGLAPDDIAGVEIETFATAASDWLNTLEPQTLIDLQFSLKLAIAASAHGSDLGPASQTEAVRTDETMRAWAKRVTVATHPDAGPVVAEQNERLGYFKAIPNRVTLKTTDGRSFTAEAQYAWGDPWGDRPMTDEEVKDKFRRFTLGLLSPEATEKAIEAIYNLEDIADISTGLTPLFRS